MNFLKKGPELKLSAIKVPDPLLDLYYDLKERHLLPVAAVLLIAIVVVPLALTQSGSSEEAPEPAASASGAAAEGSQQLVARSAPRLRKYQRRLAHLTAKDPFVQQYVERESAAGETSGSGSEGGAVSSGSNLSGAEEGSSGSSTPSPEPSYVPSTPSSPASELSPSPTSTPPSEPESGSKSTLKWFSYAIDVRVVTKGEASESSATETETTVTSTEPESSGEPKSTVRHKLPELTMLPSRKTPAFTYMGSTKDGKKALMLVSSDVKSIYGDARCVIGSQTCQLLAMEPELPETIVYGNSGKTYTIELRKIELVESSKINRAPLGEPEKKPRHK
jgi:hypothetical protein